MPRLLLLITDLELGGTPTVVRELATRLRSEHQHVEVACLKPMGPVGVMLREAGVTVTSFEARSVLEVKRAIASLTSIVRERQIDTVFSFLIHANFVASRAAAQLPGVRFLQSIQTTQPQPRWHWWLQRRIHRMAERVVVPSESVARRATEWSGVPREKLVVIPNAVDVSAFRGTIAPLVNHEWGAHATFRIGFVGRLDPVKRVQDLIAAMAILDAKTSLDIYGDGPERERLESLTARLDLRKRVTFHGMIADVRQAYAAIDVLVLLSEAEGFGLVLIEAMAAGVPVIGTDVDGIRDVIRHEETGLLVPPRDPAAIAEAIKRLRDDRELRDRLRSAAHADVAGRFAWSAVIASYQKLLARSSDA